MKNIKIKIFLVSLVYVVGVTSCTDMLNELPQTALTPQQVFTDLNILEPTVDGLYTSYRNAKAGREGFTFTLLGLDESKQGIVQMGDASQAALDNYDGM